MKLRLTEEIWKEGNMYVSYCPELDIASCGKDVQQAKKNLMEAIIINRGDLIRRPIGQLFSRPGDKN